MDVKTAHRISRDQQARIEVDLTAENDLLDIAAGQFAHGMENARCIDGQLGDDLAGLGPGSLAVDKDPLVEGIVLEQDIVGDIHRGDQAHAKAILRDEAHADPQLDDLAGRFADDLIAMEPDAAARRRLETSDRFTELFLAAAGQTGHAEDFAMAEGKADLAEALDATGVGHRQITDLQAKSGAVHGRAVNRQVDGPADHHFNQLGRRGQVGADGADGAALAQDRDPVTQRKDLIELMADENNRLAIFAHAVQDLEQMGDFLWGQDSRRFIEDQDLRSAIEDLEDFHGLLFTDRHR